MKIGFRIFVICLVSFLTAKAIWFVYQAGETSSTESQAGLVAGEHTQPAFTQTDSGENVFTAGERHGPEGGSHGGRSLSVMLHNILLLAAVIGSVRLLAKVWGLTTSKKKIRQAT